MEEIEIQAYLFCFEYPAKFILQAIPLSLLSRRIKYTVVAAEAFNILERTACGSEGWIPVIGNLEWFHIAVSGNGSSRTIGFILVIYMI